ncbi:WD40 repeat domain-containing protein [Aspergillus novofumigatus IBT 16806]|uniref:WD domain protein n=1 Tax=Aspergillus novofumigatus (strain IBT 16806) TaxID=1392255 RepID=A0A2I1CG39_ASPN1|nr:WD domain protein [Aspergillus novofumigatus IBT 16806]PKX96599.1 WD domain protein [Aspergillus novofumigatus IBT 16806]
MPATKQFPTKLVHTLKTHNGPVNAVTFSSYPGTYVLTGSADRAIHLSRAIPNNSSTTGHETTSPIQKYEAHGYSVLDVAVAADNARFTSVGGDRQVFLWDVEQGMTTRRWAGHNARVEAVQFAGEGDSVVVSGSADTTINLWDTRSKSHKPIQTLTEAGDTVSSLHVHMPTYSIASGSYDGRARIYDVRMGRTTVDVLAHPVTSVRCSADGNALLVSTLDSRIRMLDRADGKLLKAFGGEEGLEQSTTGASAAYRNSELRIRSVFAKGDAVVLSGSESTEGDPSPQAHVFAWDVLMKVVSCVAWNEKGGCWAGGCSDAFNVLPSEFTDPPKPFPKSTSFKRWPHTKQINRASCKVNRQSIPAHRNAQNFMQYKPLSDQAVKHPQRPHCNPSYMVLSTWPAAVGLLTRWHISLHSA